MRCLRLRLSILAAFVFTGLVIALPAHAQNKLPDSTLFTIYSSDQGQTQLSWLTCGSLPQTSGCYGSGSLGPFTNACTVVQSVPGPLNLSTVLRYIYVLDTGSSPSGGTLTVYKRTDTISQTSDTISVTRVTVVPLPTLVAGSGVTCYMAQNPTNVYVGTNQTTHAVAINKTTFAVSSVGAFSSNVAAITADSYGFVTVVQGSGFSTGNSVFAPNGQLVQDGGGSYFMINPIDAVYPATYAQ